MSNDPYAGEAQQPAGGLRKIQVPTGDYTEPVSAGPVDDRNLGPGGVPVRKPTPEILSQMQDLEKAMLEQAEKDAQEAEQEERIEIDEVPEESLPLLQTVYYRNTPIDNPKTRAQVEERCEELSFDELILSGRVTQNVPIIAGKLNAVFQSLKAADNLWIERQAQKLEDEAEARIWAGYARLVASLVAVNDRAFEDPWDANEIGGISSDRFATKYREVMDQSERVIEILLVNLAWFEDRVGNMFARDSESLKNG